MNYVPNHAIIKENISNVVIFTNMADGSEKDDGAEIRHGENSGGKQRMDGSASFWVKKENYSAKGLFLYST